MDFTTLTQTLNNFLSVFSLGYGNLLPSTLWLFGTLLSIEIVLFGIWYAFGAENIVGAMKKILFVGFWFWIVTSFPTLVNHLVDSLIQAGQLAAGGNDCLIPSGDDNIGFDRPLAGFDGNLPTVFIDVQ